MMSQKDPLRPKGRLSQRFARQYLCQIVTVRGPHKPLPPGSGGSGGSGGMIQTTGRRGLTEASSYVIEPLLPEFTTHYGLGYMGFMVYMGYVWVICWTHIARFRNL
jgi:hypothetical protein